MQMHPIFDMFLIFVFSTFTLTATRCRKRINRASISKDFYPVFIVCTGYRVSKDRSQSFNGAAMIKFAFAVASGFLPVSKLAQRPTMKLYSKMHLKLRAVHPAAITKKAVARPRMLYVVVPTVMSMALIQVVVDGMFTHGNRIAVFLCCLCLSSNVHYTLRLFGPFYF